MNFTVTLFGRLSEAIGRELELSSQGIGTVADLRRTLAERYPAAHGDLASPRVRACVNDAVVGDDHPLASGDSVALLPPVSGG